MNKFQKQECERDSYLVQLGRVCWGGYQITLVKIEKTLAGKDYARAPFPVQTLTRASDAIAVYRFVCSLPDSVLNSIYDACCKLWDIGMINDSDLSKLMSGGSDE